jgi:predicted ATPase
MRGMFLAGISIRILDFAAASSPPWQLPSGRIARLVARERPRIVDTRLLRCRAVGGRRVSIVTVSGLYQIIMAEIIQRTDGIPLFVEEMTKAVLEAESEDAAQQTVAAAPFSALAVPASLQASLMARLDRLGPAKEVAQIGAAIGREFCYELISAVADRGDDALRAGLDQLLDAGLVFQRGSLREATFLFKHALVHDAAYGTLLKGRRQQLHARIAQMMEQRTPDSAAARPELIASHYAQAGLAEKAIEYWGKAGRLAVRRSTIAEAAVHFGKALQLLRTLPKSSQQRSGEIALQLDLAATLTAVKGWASREAGEVACLEGHRS